jgi:ATP-NAD kinase C-terminal domain
MAVERVHRLLEALDVPGFVVRFDRAGEASAALGGLPSVHASESSALESADLAITFDGAPGRATLNLLFPRVSPLVLSLDPDMCALPMTGASAEYGLDRAMEAGVRATVAGRFHAMMRHRCFVSSESGAYGASDGGITRHPILHELILHRAPEPSTVISRLLVDGQHVTTVVADGVCLATASGSAGAAATFGAAAVDSSMDVVQICPINPNSLAFRPVVLPGSAHLSLQFVSARPDRRITCVADGRRLPLRACDTIHITPAPPMACVRTIWPPDPT